MDISFDPAKREWALRERGLDFLEAALVFAGPTFEFDDERFDHGERRIITVGYLRLRMVIILWTHRAIARHVISMRKANDREKASYWQRLGQG